MKVIVDKTKPRIPMSDMTLDAKRHRAKRRVQEMEGTADDVQVAEEKETSPSVEKVVGKEVADDNVAEEKGKGKAAESSAMATTEEDDDMGPKLKKRKTNNVPDHE